MPRKEYGNYRISKDTIEMLSNLKLAYEASYAKHITNDELVQKLFTHVKDSEPSVFDTYNDILSKKR